MPRPEPRTRLACRVQAAHTAIVDGLFGADAYNWQTLRRAAVELLQLAEQHKAFEDGVIFAVVQQLVERMAREASGSKHWTAERSRAENRGRVRYNHPRSGRRVNRRVAAALRDVMLGLGNGA
jgi:hypothetical protein